MGQVAFTVEAVQGRHRAIQAAFDAAAKHQVRARGSMIGATALVLARATAELRVRGYHCRVPASGLDEGGAKRIHSLGQLAKEIGMRPLLVRVRVEASERNADHRYVRGVRR